MKNIKKVLCAVLVLVLTVSLFSGCGANKATDGNVSDGNLTDGNVTDSTISDSTVSDENPSDETTVTDNSDTPSKKPSPFSSFSSTTADGKETDQSVFKDSKITLIYVWVTFSDSSIGDLADLQKLSEEYAGKGLSVVNIPADPYDSATNTIDQEKLSKAEAILKENGVTFETILPSESLNEAILDAIRTYPTFFFVDENGELIGTPFVVSRSYDQWCSTVDTLFMEMEN